MRALLLILISILSLYSERIQAEFICSSHVSYKWQKSPNNLSSGAHSSDQGKAGREVEVAVSILEVRGADEQSAKDGLQKELSRAKSDAEERCRKLHENLTSCIASKYNALGNAPGTASFSVRRTIDEAIKSDCESLTGECLGALVSEPKCSEKVEVKPAEGQESSAAESKEGEKGKDKKKK